MSLRLLGYAFAASASMVAACAGPPASAPAAQRTAAHPVPTAPAAVTLTYLGVAGWELRGGADALLFDPYLSRLPARDGMLLVPDEKVIREHVPLGPGHSRVILVSHSHYDHLLDVPTIAKATGAEVVGTESTANVARAAGVAVGSLLVVHGGETFDVGPFSVHPIRALHSLTGQPTDTIGGDVTWPMKAEAFAEGGTLQYLVRFAGRSILFLGTANLVESELAGLRPDVAIVAVGLREKVPDYSCRLMRALGQPPLVLTNHFDAHREPLGPSQMHIGEEGRKDLASFADEVHACAPETKVVVPTHFEPIAI